MSTSPMLKQILATIWDTMLQHQHIFFPQSNDQDIWIQPTNRVDKIKEPMLYTLYPLVAFLIIYFPPFC